VRNAGGHGSKEVILQLTKYLAYLAETWPTTKLNFKNHQNSLQ